MMGIVDANTHCSGQRLNPSKCKFFLPSNAPTSRVRVVTAATYFDRGFFPFIYLGLSVRPGKQQIWHFQHIIDCIAKRTNGWQSKFLSSAGRLVLIKHVHSSMPIHVLSATSIPKECLKKIEAILAKFFWGSTEYGGGGAIDASGLLFVSRSKRAVSASAICGMFEKLSS